MNKEKIFKGRKCSNSEHGKEIRSNGVCPDELTSIELAAHHLLLIIRDPTQAREDQRNNEGESSLKEVAYEGTEEEGGSEVRP